MALIKNIRMEGGAGYGILVQVLAKCTQSPYSHCHWKRSLYKYMKADHAKSLMVNGTVKVGSLYDFRNIDEHDEWIGDRLEGFQSRYTTNTYFEKENFHGANLENVRIDMGGRATATVLYSSPDYYLYCTSIRKDKKILLESEKYDTCVEITNPNLFFDELTKAISKRFNLLYQSYECRPVIYKKKSLLIDTKKKIITNDLWYTKCDIARYRNQREVRTRWAPINRTKNPIDPNSLSPFDVPSLSQYCRIIEV